MSRGVVVSGTDRTLEQDAERKASGKRWKGVRDVRRQVRVWCGSDAGLMRWGKRSRGVAQVGPGRRRSGFAA